MWTSGKVFPLWLKKNTERNSPSSFTGHHHGRCDAWKSCSHLAAIEEVVSSVKGNTLKVAEQKGGKYVVLDDAPGPLKNQPWNFPSLELLRNNKKFLMV